ncbi:MAG: DUF309 domain-containing protein, partial [Cyanobacteria bacterium]|nr:DUF309 domain-containing protein [Cyanobacteriota bacterium]
ASSSENISMHPFSIPPPPALFMEGVALFNQEEFFECHEVLEDLWRPLPPGGERELVQGILQVGVGFYHLQKGNERGAKNVLGMGLTRLAPVLAQWADYKNSKSVSLSDGEATSFISGLALDTFYQEANEVYQTLLTWDAASGTSLDALCASLPKIILHTP